MRLGVGTRCARTPSWSQTVTWIRSTTIVQLGLALLGLGNDGVGAGIVFKLPETIRIVCVDDFHKASLMDRAPGILVEEVPEGGGPAVENHVFERRLGGALAIPRTPVQYVAAARKPPTRPV